VHGGRFSAYKEVGNKELAGVCLFGLGFGDEVFNEERFMEKVVWTIPGVPKVVY
jgi:hypothetical protein